MSVRASELWRGVREELVKMAVKLTPDRVLVESYTSGRVKIREIGAPSALGEEYARIAGFKLEPGAKVLTLPMGDKLIVAGEIQNTPPTSRTFDHDLVIEGDLAVSGVLTGGGLSEGAEYLFFYAWNSAEASTSNTSTPTAHSSFDIELPAGTWDVDAVGLATCRASGANGVDMRMRIDGNNGTLVTETPGAAPGIAHRAHYKRFGVASGTRTITTQYKSNGTGTAYLRNVICFGVAEKAS